MDIFNGCSLLELNRLLSKGMSNICLNVTMEKNWRSQTFDFQSLKHFSPCLFVGSSSSRGHH